MKVYRWEHKEFGVGPLCGGTEFKWRRHFYDHKGPWSFPEFRSFIDTKNNQEDCSNYFFGMSTVSGVKALMQPDAEIALAEEGFELMTYEVSEDFVVMPDGQVAFNKSKAVRIN